MATSSDIANILQKYQAERGDDVQISKQLQRQQQKEKKGVRPPNISREVFALMTKQEIENINNEANPD